MSGVKEMSFLDHLEALRWHLIRSVIAISMAGVWAFFNKHLLFDVIIFGPKRADFITYRALCKLSPYLHQWAPFLFEADGLCMGQDFPDLQNLEMGGQFTTHMVVALVAGFIIAFPYIIWEIWRFISPALSPNERKNSKGFIFFTSFLFFLGVIFSYYIIAPLSINFFLTYQISDSVKTIPQLGSYISTFTSLILGCGAIFELPILIFFLTKIGLITADFLKKYRKHSFIICLILAGIITPPDVFSQILVTAPLMVLYEISIYVAKWVERSRAAEFDKL